MLNYVCLIALLVQIVGAFVPTRVGHSLRASENFPGYMAATTSPEKSTEEKYTQIPGMENVIRPSITDKARTVTVS